MFTILEYLEEYRALDYNTRKSLDASYRAIESKIKLKVFRFRDAAIFSFDIPSEKHPEMSYNVVIEIDGVMGLKNVTIDNINMRVFSNSPSFIFGSLVYYKEKDHLCDWLTNKYNNPNPSSKSKNTVPEKSLTMAIKYLQQRNYLSINIIKGISVVSDKVKIASMIHSQDKIMAMSYSPKNDPIITKPNNKDSIKYIDKRKKAGGIHKIESAKSSQKTTKSKIVNRGNKINSVKYI